MLVLLFLQVQCNLDPYISKFQITSSKIQFFELELGNKIAEFDEESQPIITSEISPCQKQLATASQDETARVWDLKTGKIIHTFQGHTQSLNSVNFSSDSTSLLTAGFDGLAIDHDLESGEVLRHYVPYVEGMSSKNYHYISALQGQQNNRIFVSFGQFVTVQDRATGFLLKIIRFEIAVSAFLVGKFDRQVIIGDISGNVIVHILSNGSKWVFPRVNSLKINHMKMDTKQHILFSSSDDGWVVMQGMVSRAVIWKYNLGESIVKIDFLSSKHQFIVNSVKSVFIIDYQSNKLLHKIKSIDQERYFSVGFISYLNKIDENEMINDQDSMDISQKQ